ncbi:hypothetical protein [Hymenobacter arizonensis]|uniref:Alpha/beta hydrolase n=1 Tax=Hymenobacter arizonensis TaxID=1227077 RepID=A0A1I5YYQ3_HYMAR|nr:hypothetical protein [Hymenobacter arizonensis]SFQ49336.1 hypothetical protein SAMN04515668_2546 [Hymenobacter arizonensis]
MPATCPFAAPLFPATLIRISLALLGSLLVLSCRCTDVTRPLQPGTQTPVDLNILTHRVLQISGDGRILPKLKGLTRESKRRFAGKYESKETTEGAYLREMFAELRQRQPRHIIVLSHGGLATFKAGLNRAVRVEQDNTLKLWRPNADTAFLYLNWNAGFFSTYGEHLITNQGQVQPLRRPLYALYGLGILAPLHLATDLGRAAVKFPLNALQYATEPALFSIGLNRPSNFYKFGGTQRNKQVHSVNLISERLRQDYLNHRGRTDSTLQISMGENRSKGAFYYHVVQPVLWLPSRLATLALGEAVGRPAWRSMLRRTQTMFHRPVADEFSAVPLAAQPSKRLVAQASRRERNTRYLSQPGVVLQFVDSLEAYRKWRTRQEPAAARAGATVTLMGHSMGCIVMKNILQESLLQPRERRLQCDHIVFMAAACSLQDFRYAVAPYLQQHAQTRFYNLTLHPYREITENMIGDYTIPSLLRLPLDGSLPVMIDRLFTDPLTLNERTLGRWHNFVLAAADSTFLPASIRGRVTIKAFGSGSRLELGPQIHGDFGSPRLAEKNCDVFYPHRFWTRKFREAE